MIQLKNKVSSYVTATSKVVYREQIKLDIQRAYNIQLDFQRAIQRASDVFYFKSLQRQLGRECRVKGFHYNFTVSYSVPYLFLLILHLLLLLLFHLKVPYVAFLLFSIFFFFLVFFVFLFVNVILIIRVIYTSIYNNF